MARAFVIHRRDMNNLPYESSDSYNPPNDNRLIDDYGNIKASISVPVSVPQEDQSLIVTPPSKFVWAGNDYVVKSITRDQANGAFNLPKDIKDPALPISGKYVDITPHFTVNIEAYTSNTQRSTSSITSLATQVLHIMIPVYKQSDFNKINTPNVKSVQYNGTANTFDNIHEFMKPGSELYGIILQDNKSEIQLIPKNVCVISDEVASTIPKQNWNHVCDNKGNQDFLCRMKNSNEVAGYSQGLVKFVKDRSVIPVSLLMFKTIGFSKDPDTIPIPNKVEDGIPVEIEGKGDDGSIQKFKIVVDKTDSPIGITNGAIVVFSAVVIGVSLLTITSLSDNVKGYSYYIPRMLLLLLGTISLPVISSSTVEKGSGESLKILSVSMIVLFMIAVLGVMIYTMISPLYPTIPGVTSGVSLVLLLTLFALFSFIYSMVINYSDATDSPNTNRNVQVGHLITYIPKLVGLSLLFLTNPSKNIMSVSSFSSSFDGKAVTDIDISKGIEKLITGMENSSVDVTNEDIGNALRYIQKGSVGDNEDMLISRMSGNNKLRAYYVKNVDDGIKVQSRVFRKNETNSYELDPKETPISDEYEMMNIDAVGGNPITPSHIIIVGLLVLSLCLIFLQPTPTPKTDDETEKMVEFWISTGVNLIIALSVGYLWWNNVFGNTVGIPLILSIIGNMFFKVGLLFNNK